jgi:hypothetical protein
MAMMSTGQQGFQPGMMSPMGSVGGAAGPMTGLMGNAGGNAGPMPGTDMMHPQDYANTHAQLANAGAAMGHNGPGLMHPAAYGAAHAAANAAPTREMMQTPSGGNNNTGGAFSNTGRMGNLNGAFGTGMMR